MRAAKRSGPRRSAAVLPVGAPPPPRQAPVHYGAGVVGVAERGVGGLVEGRDWVVSFDGQQGKVAAQHGQGLAFVRWWPSWSAAVGGGGGGGSMRAMTSGRVVFGRRR